MISQLEDMKRPRVIWAGMFHHWNILALAPLVPKYLGAEIFQAVMSVVPNIPRAKNSTCRKVQMSKTLLCWDVYLSERPQGRRVHVLKCSHDETSVPKWLLLKCSVPKWRVGDRCAKTDIFCQNVWQLTKGQLISKADWSALDSPKKQTDKVVLFAFLLLMANKLNSFVSLLRESRAHQSAFRFNLTFRLAKNGH